MNTYYEKLKFVQQKTLSYLEQIFKCYGNELLLRLEEYNLLSNENNCLETSTAIGFILEEFITSKLEVFTETHDNKNEIRVHKITGQSTVSASYDCYIYYEDIFFMINIKGEKYGSANCAVAAINALYHDYVLNDPEQAKAFMVLKTRYTFDHSKRDGERKIQILGTDSYFLEEFDFSNGHRQDHRNWSEKFNPRSGRLQLSNRFRRANRLDDEEISYERTKEFINKM